LLQTLKRGLEGVGQVFLDVIQNVTILNAILALRLANILSGLIEECDKPLIRCDRLRVFLFKLPFARLAVCVPISLITRGLFT
jgi:hypothetical protein